MNLNIFGTPKEKRTQLYFRDDGKFQLRKLEIVDGFLVEKENEEVKKGWVHFFKTQLPFDGFRNMKMDMVTLGFSRDIILDPFGKVPESDKPIKGRGLLVKDYITKIAESQRYKVQNKPGGMLLINKITLFLGAALILLIVILGINIAA